MFCLGRKICCRIERSQKPLSHQAPSSLPRSLAVGCGCSTEGYRAPKLAPLSLFSDRLELDQKGLVVDKSGKMNPVSMSVGHDSSDNLIRRRTLLDGSWIRFFISLRIYSLKSSNFTRLDGGFLGRGPECWVPNHDYQGTRTTVQAP